MRNPFRYFNSSPQVIRLVVMMYIRYPLSLRQVEDLLFERGIDICHETVRFWWNRFGPMFAAEIRQRRVDRRSYSRWRWHLDEVFVRINGETRYLWRAVDHEGEVLEAGSERSMTWSVVTISALATPIGIEVIAINIAMATATTRFELFIDISCYL